MKNEVKIEIEGWTTKTGVHTEARVNGSATLAAQVILCTLVDIVEKNHTGNPIESVNGLCEVFKEIAEETFGKEGTTDANLPN